ncbi:MAG TPA: hypothetical protein VGD99_23930 [Anaerolineae bacterium]|jgi:hypothetical protein
MAGNHNSGRRGQPGFAIRVVLRYRAGVDPPELGTLLKKIEQAPTERRQEILNATLLGGIDDGQDVANATESTDTARIIDDLFGMV